MLYLKFYTNMFVGRGFAGTTYGPFIFIRPEYRDDKGLLEHEKVHVKQFWRSLGLHGIFYNLSKKYRFKCEVEAYRKQLEYVEWGVEPIRRKFAEFIANKYNLNVSVDEAYEKLK